MRCCHLTNALIATILQVGLALGQANGNQPLIPGAKPTLLTVLLAQTTEAKPGSQMERLLRAFEGTWAIKENIAPDPASPNGTTGEGQIAWRSGPGGFSVIEDYTSKQGTRKVGGLGVFWWDEASNGYRTIWCDSTNPGGCISFKSAARWEGAQLILVEDYEVNGKKVIFKEVFGDITSTGFTQTLNGGESGKELKVDQTIRATKIRPEPPK
jgi:hypothetical protein